MDEAQRKRLDAFARERFEAIREQGVGQAAIFMEYPTVHYVRVTGVTTDDWGVTLQITCIPAKGFALLGHEQRESGKVSCAWRAWSAQPAEWRAQQISWQLYFDPEFVEALVAEAAETKGEGAFLHYREVMLSSAFHRYRSRGLKIGDALGEGE